MVEKCQYCNRQKTTDVAAYSISNTVVKVGVCEECSKAITEGIHTPIQRYQAVILPEGITGVAFRNKRQAEHYIFVNKIENATIGEIMV